MPPTRSSGSPAGALSQVKSILASITFDVILGKVAGFTTALVGVYLSARKIQEALKESAGAEALKNQFISLGQSASQAEAKVASLAKMAANGAVSFESLGNAAKILRVIGGAAADTEGNLKQISDVFAASGAPVAAVATAYAQFYQGIKNGGDASSSAQEMANLGGISQDAATKIRDLTESGASASQMLRTMQTAMDSTQGASEALRGSVVGLQAQLRNLEQENNVKLGENFMAGEKAALRTQIAFENLKNTLQTGIAEAIAPIKNAWSGLLEKIVTSGGASSAVKGLTVAMQALAYAAGGAILTLFASAVQGLVGLVPAATAGLMRMGGVLGLLAMGLRATAGFLMTAAGGWFIFGTALTAAATAALKAYENIQRLNEEAAKNSAKSNSQSIQNKQDISTVRTPEEQQMLVENIDQQINDVTKQQQENNKRLADAEAQKKKMQGAFSFVTPWGRKEVEEKINVAKDESRRLGNQKLDLVNDRKNLLESKGIGVDTAEDKRLRDRAVLERDIRNQGVQALQGSLSPDRGLAIGRGELDRLKIEQGEAEKDAPQTAKQRREINTLAKKAVLPASATTEEFSSALNDLAGYKPTTEVARLDQDATLRTTLREEKARQESEFLGAKNGSEEQKRARAKMDQINSVIATRFGGDESQISAAKTQEIERQRDDTIKRMDPNELRRQVQSQMDANQQMEMSAGAKEASIQKERERVDLETQLASISDNTANGESKAAAAGNQRVAQLQKAAAASEDLDKATKAYQDSRGTSDEGQKKEELQKALITAAKAGVEGRSTSEINQELSAEKQILEVKLSAARVAENAAKAEYESTQRRLALERQMVELRANQAQQLMGNAYGNKGENEIKGEAQDKEIAKKEEALAAAKARDAADAAAKADPSKENLAASRAAQEKLSALGVNPNVNTRDVESQLQDLKQQRADTAIKEVNQNNRSSMEMQIRGARIQEQYAPGSSTSQAAKQVADTLEDQLAKADRVKELTAGGMKGENAERVADIETQRNRIISNIEKEGKPEVSSMARIGGSSGWAGVVGGATQDKQAKLENLNQAMVTLLAQLAKDSEQGLSYYRVLQNNNN